MSSVRANPPATAADRRMMLPGRCAAEIGPGEHDTGTIPMQISRGAKTASMKTSGLAPPVAPSVFAATIAAV